MFWGVTILPGRRYSQMVEVSYHISKAVLEIDVNNPKAETKRAQLFLEHNKTNYLLCNLDSEKVTQTELDLIFTEEENVTFYVKGNGTVHLTGYIMDFQGDDDDDLDEEDEDMEIPNSNKRRLFVNDLPSKKSKTTNGKDDDDEDEDEDEEDDEEDDDLDEDALIPDEEDDEEDEEGDDEEDEDEEESDKQSLKKVDGAPKVNGQMKKPNDVQNKNADVKMSNANQQNKNQQKQKFGQGQQNKFGNQKGQPNSAQKFNQNKNQGDNQFNKQKGSFTPGNKVPEWKELNKVKIFDVHEGSGQVTKKGKFVHLKYVGTLWSKKSGFKEFDRSGDKPFSFKLGQSYVVKGLEAGIEGMKVGGKRIILIPPDMGYGKQCIGPIPANSTLKFEVELISVT